MEEAGTLSGHQESKVRIVRLPSSHRVWCTAATTGGAGCATDNWREHLRHEVRHHSFALLSFVDQDHHHHEENGVKEDEQKVERRKSLRHLVADHRERVRPQFFDQPASAKRRLDPDVFAAEATENKDAAHGSERAKVGGRLGDTGYCLREGIKEQLQVRLGPRMPWPTIGSMIKEEMETLFEMLDGVGRRCASALVTDGSGAQLLAMLDPSPEHLRDLLHSKSASKERNDEKSEDEDCGADYTSSSVMTLTRYFNNTTDQGTSESCRAHGDAGLVTLVVDPTPGLQLFDPCGAKWLDCADLAPLEQSQGVQVDAVLMIGEALHRFTRGGVGVTSHRMVNTGQPRSSTAFQLRPRPDVVGPRTEADYALTLLQQPVVAQLKRREEEAVALWQETGFDVLVHVLGFLRDERDVGRCALVSRAWREAADSHILWRRIVTRMSLDLVARYAAKHESEVVDKNESQSERENEEAEVVVDYKRLYVEYVRELQESAGHLKDMHEAQDFYLNQVHLPPLGSPDISLKIVTIGSGAVGKTSMLMTFASGSFPHDYTPTVCDGYLAKLQIDGNVVSFDLWDTAGEWISSRLGSTWCGVHARRRDPKTDCFFVCFAVNDRASLAEARDKFVPEVRLSCPSAPIILVGTKADLRDTDDTLSLIPIAEGVALAQELGLLMYVECSAKTNSNVQEVVHLGIKAPLLKAAGLLRLHHTNSRGRGAKKKKTKKKAAKRDQCSMQ